MRRSVYLWGILTAFTALVPYFAFQGEFSSRALGYPLYDSGGDNYFGWAMTKAVIEGHFIPFVKMSFPRMAAPFGPLSLSEGFPIPEQLQFLVIRLFGLFSHDPIRVQNLFYLSGYIFSSIAFFASAVWIGIRPALAFGLSFAFTYLTYHLIRYHHVALSHYWVLAPAAALILKLLEGRFGVSKRDRWIAFAASFGIALWHSYYGYFFTALYAIAWLLRNFPSSTKKEILTALGGVGLGFVLALGISTANYVVARSESSDRPAKFERLPGETRYYRLRLESVLFPSMGHRIPAFARLRRHFWLSRGQIEGTDEAIGFTALAGLFIGLGALFRGWKSRRDSPLAPYGALQLLILFFASSFGIAIWFSYLVSPVFRSVNRISPMLAATGLFALGLALETRFASRLARSKAFELALALGLATFAVWDQVPSFRVPPQFISEIDAVREFSAAVEKEVGDGPVLQIPNQKFPESGPIVGMLDYSHIAGPLFSDQTKWSYGAYAGTQRLERISAVADHPLEIEAAKALGYRGIWIDRSGFVPGAAEAIEKGLSEKLGRPPIVSSDGRRSFFRY